MPHSCSARGCKSRCGAQTRASGITFHIFPKDQCIRKQWEKSLGRKGFTASKSSRICSQHFRKEDFDRTGQTVRIREGAVPSVFSFSPAQPSKPVAARTTRTAKKALEDVVVVASPPVQKPEPPPEPSTEHTYALPTCPSDLKVRLREALARVDMLEKQKRNARDRERRARTVVCGLVQTLMKKNVLNQELKDKLSLYTGPVCPFQHGFVSVDLSSGSGSGGGASPAPRRQRRARNKRSLSLEPAASAASQPHRTEMPSNVEIKARVSDADQFRARAAALSQSEGSVIKQLDTFFNCSHGRLKLRDFMNGSGQLIFYERPDTDGPKLSRYSISATSEPDTLRAVLSDSLGVRGEVQKERVLFLIGQTRVHLDSVSGLGTYMELEVVMRPGQTVEEGQQVAEDLMEQLGVSKESLVTGAYMDLILKGGGE